MGRPDEEGGREGCECELGWAEGKPPNAKGAAWDQIPNAEEIALIAMRTRGSVPAEIHRSALAASVTHRSALTSSVTSRSALLDALAPRSGVAPAVAHRPVLNSLSLPALLSLLGKGSTEDVDVGVPVGVEGSETHEQDEDRGAR